MSLANGGQNLFGLAMKGKVCSVWPKSVRSGQYLSLGMVGLANASFAYSRSGQCLFWVAEFILGSRCVDSIFIRVPMVRISQFSLSSQNIFRILSIFRLKMQSNSNDLKRF